MIKILIVEDDARLNKLITVTNLLEDGERETDVLEYKPFEMLTVAVDPRRAASLLEQ